MKKVKFLRKGLTVVAVSALFLSLFALGSCKQKSGNTGQGNGVPRTGKVKVKPHNDPQRSDTYCLYDVAAPLPTPSMFKVGDQICIYCPSGKSSCDNFSEVEMYEGTVYKVTARTNGLACTTCPAGTANPPGFAFEEQ